MFYQKETEFARHIKNDPPARVYFLFGTENYTKELYLKKLISKAVSKDLLEFNFHKFDGRQVTLDTIADACEALPLMSERTCVVVSDLDVEKLSAGDYQKLKELLADPSGSNVLIFVVTGFEVNERRSSRYKAFVDLVSKAGVAARLDSRSARDLIKYARSVAQREHTELSEADAQYLVGRSNDNMLTLTNELDKLCAYCAGRAITREDIDRCGMADLNASIFDISKAILKGDYQLTMQRLNDLIEQREEPIAILAVLSSAFIDLYRARAARPLSVPQAQLAGLFHYKGKEFRIRNAMSDCARFPEEFLRRAILLLAQTDYQMKSTAIDKTVLLQETVTSLFMMLEQLKSGALARR